MERAIVEAAAAGDAVAFASVVNEFTPTVLASAYGWCGDRHLAADVAQEVFVTAYEHMSALRDPAALPGWLMAITRNATFRLARPRAEHSAATVASDDVEHDVLAADEARRLRLAVEALPPAQRLPIALHYFGGRSLAEIADWCQLPVSTVKKRMHDGRARLRRGGLDMTPNADCPREPGEDDPTDVVRMYASLRTGDTELVAAILDARPDLVDVREAWTRAESRRHRLPLATGGGTPLLRAVERGDLAMMRLLLERGADPNAACGCAGGERPVWVAALQRDLEALDLLLAYGADANASAFAGLTALDVARVRGYEDVAERLRAAGAEPATTATVPASTCRTEGTGIKAIDLWCPLPSRGLVHCDFGDGLGAMVLLAELTKRATAAGDNVVWAGFVPSPLDVTDMRHAVAESGITDVVTLVFEEPTAPVERQVAALDAGMAAAREGGMMVLFCDTGRRHHVDARLLDLAERPGVTIVVEPIDGESDPPAPGTAPFLAAITFDRRRAALGRWPAISSNSWSVVATAEISALATQARRCLTEELDLYLCQPFHVAEPFNGSRGQSVSSAELTGSVTERLTGTPIA